MIINCHTHVYPDKICQKASDGTGRFYDINMCYDGSVSKCIEEGAKIGVTHSLIFSVATTPHQVSSINRFIAEEVSLHPDLFTGLGALHPESDDGERDIRELVDLGLRGVKLHPEIQGFSLLDERCDQIYKLCLKYNLPLLLHTGDYRYDYSNPDELSCILERYPELTVIGAHLAGYSVWDDAVEALAKRYDNLYVDCSSSLMFMTAERATEIIRTYGADRVLWGTDYPMWGYEEEMERFNALGLSEEERELILCKNAQKLFGILSQSL